MIPEVDYDYDLEDEVEDDYEEETYPNKTYKMDTVNKRISGMCDDEEALRQAVFKILNTELGEDVIYEDDYGLEIQDLFGDDLIYTESEIQVRIREAILSDDRFSTVDDFNVSTKEGKMIVSFVVYTADGEEIAVEEGVELNV